MFLVCFVSGIDYKTTTILLDGRRVKLQLWYSPRVVLLLIETQQSDHVMISREFGPEISRKHVRQFDLIKSCFR